MNKDEIIAAFKDLRNQRGIINKRIDKLKEEYREIENGEAEDNDLSELKGQEAPQFNIFPPNSYRPYSYPTFNA